VKATQGIAHNSPVWVWHNSSWPAVVVEPCSATDENMLVVRLTRGVSMPASLSEIEPRDPALLETDGPGERPRGTKVST